MRRLNCKFLDKKIQEKIIKNLLKHKKFLVIESIIAPLMPATEISLLEKISKESPKTLERHIHQEESIPIGDMNSTTYYNTHHFLKIRCSICKEAMHIDFMNYSECGMCYTCPGCLMKSLDPMVKIEETFIKAFNITSK